MTLAPAYQLDGRDAPREAFYAAACDPRRHVVVEACAGAGKTWMLVARIVRALLEGAAPHEVLAITFTRKAAGEMRERLAQWLETFAAMNEDEAAQQLRRFGVSPAQARNQARALIGLNERVLESGRAVEICTFHAWYAKLLRAAPIDLLVELGLAPGMALLEDASDLMPELMRRFHAAVIEDAQALADYRRLTARHGRTRLREWLEAALDRRVEIELADVAGVLEPSVPPADDPRAAACVRTPAFVAQAAALARALGALGKNAHKAARGIEEALALDDDHAAIDALRTALFTKEGAPKQLGDLPGQVALCDELDRITQQQAQQDAHEDHRAMTRLSRLLFAQYATQKGQRGLIDMPDLERVALSLLSQHTLSGWVQERLDARVRHLLIDEFQDTSPLQWQGLEAWLSAYAGAGGGPEAPRVFIVGDPKQSIYRFRRAEPRVFAAAQDFVVQALAGTLAACDHTRRCAPGVVGVVNRVFDALAREGRLEGWRAHSTEISGDELPLALQALPSAERPAAQGKGEAERVWRPSLTVPRVTPKVELRDAEAGAVAAAIETLVRGTRQGGAAGGAAPGVPPGEILVLARTRDVLMRAADALAARHLPHVAPEELLLGDLPEAQDLLAVLDVLASTVQSLSLARALKSPLFDASDDELLWLAQHAREQGGWWNALMRVDLLAPASLQRAAALFAAWQQAGATLPPHDLLDRIVHESDWLPRLAAVAPPERHARAMDAARALLAAALDLDGGRYATPYGFVRALKRRRVMASSVAQGDAVRLLTIHGAKGLEARVVFLMDADPAPRPAESATLLVDWPLHTSHPQRVAFLASEARCPPSLESLLAVERAARAREEINALYVALTRAKQCLIASCTPPRSSEALSWWARLLPLATPWEASNDDGTAPAPALASFVALPLASRARAGAPPTRPSTDDRAARLGQAVHRTLEWAAARARPALSRLAEAAAAEFELSPSQAGEVAAIAARILASPSCSRFFDPASIVWAGAEVAVASLDGQVRRLDRLVKLADGTWWVLDYKLAGSPQDDPALREQLADYRAAVGRLVPGEPVRAAFVTAAGELIES